MTNATTQATGQQAQPSEIAPQVILQARGLTKVYHSGPVEIRALDGVDLELYESELVVLVGASGSGKSTLLNILGGLDSPTSGDVFFKGDRIELSNDAAITAYRRQNVGFVFQFYNLIASLTAEENVALVTEIAQAPLSPADALALVGLGDRRHAFPAELSGGEQQRVAIARAIAKQPGLLLCDEPTGALDSKTGVLVLTAIEQVNRELGTTTALITHNRSISGMADRVHRFSDGKVVETTVNDARVPVEALEW